MWLGDLAIFYIIPLPKSLGEIGEKWDRSSYLQAVGFAVLVAGTLVYARGDQEEEQRQASVFLPPVMKGLCEDVACVSKMSGRAVLPPFPLCIVLVRRD